MSEKKNALQVVRERITELTSKKERELAEIQENQNKAQRELEAAGQALQTAADQMDLEAYSEAEAASRRSRMALEMYGAKYQQIQRQEYVTEAESDQTIDSLLSYERELAAEFEKDAAKHIEAISKLLTDYQQEVNDTERTIDNWCWTIRANYRTFGMSRRRDPRTGEWTDRAESPVPVHPAGYQGCDLARRVDNFLKNVSNITKKG